MGVSATEGKVLRYIGEEESHIAIPLNSLNAHPALVILLLLSAIVKIVKSGKIPLCTVLKLVILDLLGWQKLPSLLQRNSR